VYYALTQILSLPRRAVLSIHSYLLLSHSLQLAAYRARVSSPPFTKSKSRQAIRGAAPESKATTTTCSMSRAKVSCAFVMRRSARADFTGEYRFAVGLKRYCWLRIPVMLFDAPDGL
jgi:hypothetical protein